MTSQAIRDPVKDPLLTPQNSALIVIDYQPVQVDSLLLEFLLRARDGP